MVIAHVLQPFTVAGQGDYEVQAGARVHARLSSGGWTVLFNGSEILLPKEALEEVTPSTPVVVLHQKASAREEEYQSAPSSEELSS